MSEADQLRWLIWTGWILVLLCVLGFLSLFLHIVEYEAGHRWRLRRWCLACWVSRLLFRGIP